MDESKKKDRYEAAKKFVRYSDGAKMYSMGMTKFQEVAKDAKACYKIGQLVLVNTEILDKYLEKTIDGFVLDDTPIESDLSYIDQNTKVVFAGMDVTNERQKVQITVTKTDSETKEALEGAVFGLFAKEDIVNKDGKVIVKADTQIERTVTGKDGKAAFQKAGCRQ